MRHDQAQQSVWGVGGGGVCVAYMVAARNVWYITHQEMRKLINITPIN